MQRPVGALTTSVMEGHPLLFDPWGPCLCMCSQGDFLDLRSDRCGRLISLLQQSSAPAINLVLGISRESKASIYSAGQTPATHHKGPSVAAKPEISEWPLAHTRQTVLKELSNLGYSLAVATDKHLQLALSFTKWNKADVIWIGTCTWHFFSPYTLL